MTPIEIKCLYCGAEPGKPCVNKDDGTEREAPCRVRAAAAMGAPIE